MDDAARYRELVGREPPEPPDEETAAQFAYQGGDPSVFITGRAVGDEDDSATRPEQPGLFA